jgi:hypothetical protein
MLGEKALADLIVSETDKWAAIVKKIGIEPM